MCVYLYFHSFNLNFWYKATSKQTYTHILQCSPTNVGLAQAHPNYTSFLILHQNAKFQTSDNIRDMAKTLLVARDGNGNRNTSPMFLFGVIRGYHVNQTIWTPHVGEKATMIKEPGNKHNRSASNAVMQLEYTTE